MSIDHLDLVVTSLPRSLEFYRGLLLPLGYVRVSEIEGERGEHVVYLGRISGMGSVSLREAQSDAHVVPYDRYGVGLHHLAFSASSRGTVDERAAWLRAQGAEIESGPEEYDYTPATTPSSSTTSTASSSSSSTARRSATSSRRSGGWRRAWSAWSRSAADDGEPGHARAARPRPRARPR
jgi:glyoxylase I family protein